MKKILIGGLIVGLMAVTLAFALMSRQAQGAASDKTKTTAEPQDETSFWDMFRKTFSRPEPEYNKPSRNVTTVAGVRGVNTEGKLGEKTDFDSVKWMEDYKLPDSKVMQFLQSRSLGPYKSSGGGK